METKDMSTKLRVSILGILLFTLLLTACASALAPDSLSDMLIEPSTPNEASGSQDIPIPVDILKSYNADVAFINDEIDARHASQDYQLQNETFSIFNFTEDLVVHFLDVGQADSTFIQLPNGQTILIDGGNSSDASSISRYLRSLNITTIDYLVVTHPHADHIGGLPAIIDEFEIVSVYMPNVSHNTQTFERLLNSIQNKGLLIDAAKDGVSILSEPELEINIVAPVRDNYRDLNDHSAVIKLTYKNASFIFMGDAETLSEGHITADVSADVLKVGHHGSRTSTSAAFLSRVDPTYAVISVGSGNTYGHPTDEVLSRLDNAGVDVFRTDLQGTIVFISDGESITVDSIPTPYQSPEPAPAAATSGSGMGSSSAGTEQDNSDSNDTTVYRTRTGQRYHKGNCRHLSQSKIETTLSAAKSQGLTACGTCRPPN